MKPDIAGPLSVIVLVVLAAGCTSYRMACTRCSPVFGAPAAALSAAPANLRRERTVSWEMNNILFSSSDRSLNKFRDFDESTILASATLYDDALIHARVDSAAAGDSARAESLMTAYTGMHEPDRLLRIRVELQAYFARRSVEPDVWVLYLVDENGDMYEPERVSEAVTDEMTVLPVSGRQPGISARYRTVFNVYFPHRTFYGTVLAGPGREFLKLVFSYNRHVVGGGGWCFGGG